MKIYKPTLPILKHSKPAVETVSHPLALSLSHLSPTSLISSSGLWFVVPQVWVCSSGRAEDGRLPICTNYCLLDLLFLCFNFFTSALRLIQIKYL